jgi:hypothetical protein
MLVEIPTSVRTKIVGFSQVCSRRAARVQWSAAEPAGEE